jgi:hypothetical protein
MLCSISFNALQIQWYLFFHGLSYIILMLIGAYKGFLQNHIYIQPLILGARIFACATKKNVAFVIYAIPTVSSTKKGV